MGTAAANSWQQRIGALLSFRSSYLCITNWLMMSFRTSSLCITNWLKPRKKLTGRDAAGCQLQPLAVDCPLHVLSQRSSTRRRVVNALAKGLPL